VHDPIRSAYATLDLAPYAPLWRVRRQYKALVRQWHPDRFAGDPQGVAEATIRMRAINEAFDAITRARGPVVDTPLGTTAARAEEPALGSRLSQEEIDRIVGSIRPAWTLSGWFADDPWNRAVPLALVVIELFVAGWQGWHHPYYRFTRIPQTNAMLADAFAVGMLGFLFLAMIWFDFDPSRMAWGSGRWAPSPAGLPKIVGWLGIALLFLALPVAFVFGL
jgi:DnaJ domain